MPAFHRKARPDRSEGGGQVGLGVTLLGAERLGVVAPIPNSPPSGQNAAGRLSAA